MALEAFLAVGLEVHPAPTDYRSRRIEAARLAAWVPGEQALLSYYANSIRQLQAQLEQG